MNHSPLVAQQQLAQQLMNLRVEAGLTQDQVAKRLGVSVSTVLRSEALPGVWSPTFLRALGAYYNLSEQRQQALLRLRAEARTQGWWVRQGLGVPTSDLIRVRLRGDVRQVYGWALNLVPEMMQTAEYARAVESHLRPANQKDAESAVALLSAIQRRVRRRGIDQRYVLDEAVIRRGVGGPQVMADQLSRLRQMAVRGRLRVLAWDSGQYSPVGGFELCFVPELGTALYKPHTQKISVPAPSDNPSLDFFRTALTHLWEHAADAAATTALIDHARAQLLGAQASDVHTTAS